MSLVNLLARLGGLCDLWLGFNVIALVHCIIYSCQAFMAYYRRTDIAGLEENGQAHLVILASLKTEVESQQLRLRAKINKLKELKGSGHRWGFLWHNKFFSETPITGFSFISDASQRLVVLFWWTLIILFLIITIINVSNGIRAYQQRPTRVIVDASAEGQSALPNLTLTVQVPVVEFAETMSMAANIQGIMGRFTVQNLFCAIAKVEDFPDALRLPGEWLDSASEWRLREPGHEIYSYHRDSVDWKSNFDNASLDLEQLLHYVAREPPSKNNRFMVWQQFMEIIDQPLQKHPNGFLYLFLLESFRTGEQPFFNMMAREGKLSNTRTIRFGGEDKQVEVANSPDTTANIRDVHELLGNISARDIYLAAKNVFSEMVYVQLVEMPLGQVHLKEWNTFINHVHSTELITGLTVSFHIVVPPGTNELRIKVLSFLVTWLRRMLLSFGAYLRNQKNLCGIGTLDEVMFQRLHHIRDSYFGDGFLGFGGHSRIQIGGQIAEVFKNSITEYTVANRISLASNVHNCSNGALEECSAECIIRAANSKCGCVPWVFLYRGVSETICTAPCDLRDVEQQCNMDCEQLLMHPCHKTLTRLVLSARHNNDAKPDDAVYDVRIRSAKKAYLAYTESYEMTIDDFIANIGGLLDLWMGINLFSFIHILLYLIKNCKRRCDRSSSTATVDNAQSDIQDLDQNLTRRMEEIHLEIEKRMQAIETAW